LNIVEQIFSLRYQNGIAEFDKLAVHMNTDLVKKIQFPKLSDDRGSLVFGEGRRHIPFDIQRIYFLYDIRDNMERGAHAHRELEQVLIAVSGKFRLALDNGSTKSSIWLSDPTQGIYVGRMVWHVLDNFTDDAVCLSLASHPFCEDDYIRNYQEFVSVQRRGCD